jgi:tetratricopeptide (TPR) repeat protein
MRRFFGLAVCLFVFFLLPVCLLAEDNMTQANALHEKGKANIENYKQAAELYAKVLEAKPDDYESAWKASRDYRFYADESKKKNAPNWKGTCKDYGKLGMKYGEKAVALNPNGVEGNFWYGCSVGSYSDGVSIFKALKEGLKDKTQTSFEKSYQINKMYTDGGPIKALGRFWFVLPWPLQKKDVSLKYLKEYQKLFPNDAEGQVYLGEVLMKTGSKDEAKTLLQKASTSSDKYYADWAKKLLAE